MGQHKMVHGALGLRVSEIPAVRMSVERGLQLGAAAEIGPLQCANNVSIAPLRLRNIADALAEPHLDERSVPGVQCRFHFAFL